MREWAFWRKAELDPSVGRNPALLALMISVPSGWMKPMYACRGWVPLASDRAGNYLGVDLDPGPGGSWGQVIIFGRDYDRKVVVPRCEGEGGWGRWLSYFVDEIESGDTWEMEDQNKTSGDSPTPSNSDEDEEIGWESYNGLGKTGEDGKSMRMGGEFKGWDTLAAYWEKSVRMWENLGLGMDVEEVERGIRESERLKSVGAEDKGKTKDVIGLGGREGGAGAMVEIPGQQPVVVETIADVQFWVHRQLHQCHQRLSLAMTTLCCRLPLQNTA